MNWFPLRGRDDVDQFLLVEKEGEGRQKMKTKYRVLLLQHELLYLPKQLTIVIGKAELKTSMFHCNNLSSVKLHCI